MRKTKFSAVISTAIVCYLFWLLLSEQAVALIHGHASGQALFAGVIVCLAAGLFSSRFFIHTNPFHLFHPGRLLNLLVYCLIIFPWELIKANVSVAICALKPSLPINPGIVKIPVKAESEYGQLMVANSITLTPGTITMDVAEEKGRTYFYIHCIDVPAEDPEEAGEAIKGTMEKWIRRIWK